jgi:hypothetical protein
MTSAELSASRRRLRQRALGDEVRRKAAEPVTTLVVLAGDRGETALGVRLRRGEERESAVGRPDAIAFSIQARLRPRPSK